MTSDPGKIIDELNAYLEGSMGDDDRKIFEKRLKEEHGLPEQLDALKKEKALIREGVKEQWRLKAIEELENQSINTSKPTSRINRLNFYRIAAVFLVLVAMVVVWRLNQPLPDPESLFASYYEAPLPSYPRSETPSNQETFSNAMQAYEEGEFRSAILQFEIIANLGGVEIDQSKNSLYLGICHMELGQYKEAIESFASVSTSSSFYPEAIWYMSLCTLRSGELERTKTILEQIIDSQHYKNTEARKILSKL